ncbi:MAG: hypothetical protein PHC97_04755 [Patescibacteria group bacterium]|nr:hypothetical protein [Patescibacteria group bacterium]
MTEVRTSEGVLVGKPGVGRLIRISGDLLLELRNKQEEAQKDAPESDKKRISPVTLAKRALRSLKGELFLHDQDGLFEPRSLEIFEIPVVLRREDAVFVIESDYDPSKHRRPS